MMSALDYRARADALETAADAGIDYPLMLQLDASAQGWRRLADMADWQDAMLAALAATGDGGDA
jgi:hypothetical protein